MGCNLIVTENDYNQMNHGNYRERFEKEAGRPVHFGHDLHHLYPQAHRSAFHALGIDIDAKQNLVELPNIVHNYVLHGAYAFGNWVNEWNSFWNERGLLTNGSVDADSVLSMSSSERSQLASEAQSFAKEMLDELGKGVDLGEGVRLSDCIGGAPY